MSKKNQLPKGHQSPVRASAIVSDIKNFSSALDVRSHTFKLQSFSQKNRERMKREGEIHILDCYYTPDGTVFPPSEIPHVDVWIHAVEKETWTRSGVRSEQIQRLVREHLDYVSANEAWNTCWRLSIKWLGQRKMLEHSSRLDFREEVTRLVERDSSD